MRCWLMLVNNNSGWIVSLSNSNGEYERKTTFCWGSGWILVWSNKKIQLEKILIWLRGTAIALEARNAEAPVEAIGKEANLEDERIDFQQREKRGLLWMLSQNRKGMQGATNSSDIFKGIVVPRVERDLS